MPCAATTLVALRPVTGQPVRRSMTCERRTPSTVIHCSASPDVETAARTSAMRKGSPAAERGDRHRPGRLPGRRIPGDDVAADRHQRRAGAVRAQDAQRLLGGVALGDAAGVDLDPGLGERDGAAPRIEPHLGEAAGGASGGDAIRLRARRSGGGPAATGA